jgi:hypothetical protein
LIWVIIGDQFKHAINITDKKRKVNIILKLFINIFFFSMKSTRKHGIKFVGAIGLLENRPELDLSKHFKVIQKEPSTKDENINDRIQREGGQMWGGSSEAQWYREHKGYSEKLPG